MPSKQVCDIGVVIVAYNSAPVIEGLLTSIPKALGGLTALIVVVDNGSTDQTVEVVEAVGGCLVVLSGNNGYAGGINIGVAALSGTASDVEAILVLNPDVRLGPGSIESMLTTLRTTRAGVVAPQVLDPGGSLFRSLRREPTLLRSTGFSWTHHPVLDEYVSDPRCYRHRQIVDWALGAALLVRREVHAALDGWDESFFLYSEETDLCLRAADRGWPTVYEPAAVVTHLGGASGRSERTHVMQIVNRVRLYSRRHHAPASFGYLVLAVLSETSWMLRGKRESRAAITALLRPATRPPELGCSTSLLPR